MCFHPISPPRRWSLALSDHDLIARLRAGEEAAFHALVGQYHASMVRVAGAYCRNHGAIEEVVQETWMAVLKGLERFEQRSSLKTWIFRILTNRAKTRATRESRVVPFSSLDPEDDRPIEPENLAAAGHWSSPPEPWSKTPEQLATNVETGKLLLEAIAELPGRQRLVITYRDVEGWKSEEVCNVLEITDTNQRVLLHRARTKVRKALAAYLAGNS